MGWAGAGVGRGGVPGAKWTTFRYTLKKKKTKPNRKHEAGVRAGAEMPAERMVLACNKRPFFPLRQCALVSRGHLW